ncbi:nitric oxide reductase transcriptional regulator NorR [Lacibacterium aquatile]|uniref:Nitric oxide reductase transcriptional regulator NorR n=1 Tax=Lacibacterium aquatile TaxID=1168082 RepID=A0ABW5DVP8_9PROT
MTSEKNTLLPLLQALAGEAKEVFWSRALTYVRDAIPCDAVAFLRKEGSVLVPVAIHGLSPEVMGRRFKPEEQPRLDAILGGSGLTRFPADSDLPDPYDGLVPNTADRLHIHDCAGVRLVADGKLWGVLTLDALEAGGLDGAEPVLEHLATVFSALVTLESREGRLQEQLARAGEAHRSLTEALPARGEIIGKSPPMQTMLREIDTVADSDLSVLVTGETGVGKELAALRLHRRSRRADASLIYLNCAALPENLVESELFGHVRGAFSGAIADRRGRFELADGGTLFLDEVGELPLAAQTKLLRALQNGEIQRVGSDRHITVDVRIVAATNRDLSAEVRAGRFRADLYHRLSVYPLQVPPLRQRGRDILLLAGHFLELQRARLRLRNIRLAPDAESLMLDYGWPGNVRELEHVISRAAVRALADGSALHGVLTLTRWHLDLQPVDAVVPIPVASLEAPLPEVDTESSLRDAMDALQRRLLTERIAAANGNLAAAGRSLGIDRSNLLRLAKRLGLAIN